MTTDDEFLQENEQYRSQVEALKAQIEVLENALKHLHYNAKASGAEMGLALEVAEAALPSLSKGKEND